ncbi:SPX domain-containing protein [Amylocarpus encephaloides]|uniref:SPX domain-containing protein n=1 Tax=Amylocarpus encephaloides TaxID=45428 RepID=A0A9P7YD54_9HELO|nr:SPX domain-containing protein [Amylocarpus encephaloides]
MKFAKELEQDLVPEWRAKYLDYKAGKKHVKAVARAAARMNTTPRNPSSQTPRSNPSGYGSTTINPRVWPRSTLRQTESHTDDLVEPLRESPAPLGTDSRPESGESTARPTRSTNTVPPLDILHKKPSPTSSEPAGSYGSFVRTPPPLVPVESRGVDTDLVAYDQVKLRQKDFFIWMDKQLEKIETFYKLKEDEAGLRLEILREQLHEMRNRRIEEVATAQNVRYKDDPSGDSNGETNGFHKNGQADRPGSQDQSWFDPIERAIGGARAKAFGPRMGGSTKALQKMGESPAIRPSNQAGRNHLANQNQDYVRRVNYADEVPYRTAKRKLKLALREFYRSMELLKSYALLNRTAFRKINKKYDKAIDAHPPLRYMSDKVNKAWFVQSDVLDSHLHAVEDLYARYFERGNHKVAVGKLRSPSGKGGDQSASAFQNGILIGTGVVFAIQGLIYGRDLLNHPDPTVRVQTGYLLQLYAGYFLALYLFCWFCLDCSIWARNKINYTFVFEFDPRHNLDWRQLSEFPSLLILVLGLFVWVNFTRYGAADMYIYFPVILILVTIVLIFFPAPILYHRSRKWFVYSNWRLLLAGLYPVERYYDTRNVFPHLVNCGKYGMTILFYATLSIYRIHQSRSNLALFSTFATMNSIYVCKYTVWDLLMDWSLLQPNASKRLLRDVRGFKHTWWYYGAMIIDPILRCNWIFYSMYTHDLQHSTLVSFLVALSEVTRRGIWTLFRVENEHCSNVARFKAARDVPLPYSIHTTSEEDLERQETEIPGVEVGGITSTLTRHASHTTATALEARQGTSTEDGGSLRRRPTPVRTFTKVIADAHTQDFEKKRKPGVGDSDSAGNRRRDSEVGDDVDGSSDDDDENDAEDILDAEDLIRQRNRNGSM